MTGVADPVDQVLARAEADLAAKRTEAAAYGRSVWKEIFPGTEPPSEDRELLRRLFDRIAADRAKTTEVFIADYRTLLEQALDFVRSQRIMTLPEPTTILLDRSPSFFLGQSVGGVYPAGPYAPEAKTLYYLPTPPDDATPEQKDAFFRDFNHHFNVMITPHEIVPGHYVQLKLAARHPRKVRAVFFDGVYVEGWGTFCERLLLDLGWEGPWTGSPISKSSSKTSPGRWWTSASTPAACPGRRSFATSGTRLSKTSSSRATCGFAPSPAPPNSPSTTLATVK